MKKTFFLIAMTIFSLYACSSSDDSGNGTPTPDPDPIENSVKLSENGTHGKFLTDSEGKTLYFFSNDSKTASTCEDGCLSVWPVFYEASLTLDNGLESSDFGTITRGDGDKQTTYKGWPLYYYASDTNAGDVKGDGVNNIWFVAKPDYSLMYANAQLIGNDGKNYIVNDSGEYVEGEGSSTYITDALGNTLYAFSPDKKDMNTYTEPDFSNDSVWPIFYIDLDRLPSNLSAADFNVIKVHGERDQLTYKGWPLYYFGPDEAKGDNKGVSVPTPGVWPIVDTDIAEAPEQM